MPMDIAASGCPSARPVTKGQCASRVSWRHLPISSLLALLLVGCAGPGSRFARHAPHTVNVRAVIDSALPAAVSDRAGWTADIALSFSKLGLPPTRENACAVVAVIEQES